MITLGILAGVVSAIGIVKSVRLVATDGFGRVPTRTYPHMFSIR
ncbi:MAG: hypothetical protein ABWZ91_15840 [Nocardioides sp.]